MSVNQDLPTERPASALQPALTAFLAERNAHLMLVQSLAFIDFTRRIPSQNRALNSLPEKT